MNTFTSKADQIVTSNLAEDVVLQPFKIHGWEISTFPAAPTSAGKFQNTPTPTTPVSTGIGSAIPPSKVTPTTTLKTYNGYVGMNATPSVSVIANPAGVKHWSVEGGAQLWLMIHSPMAIDVNVTFNMRVKDAVDPNTSLSIYVNSVGITVPNQADTNTEWHNHTLVIPYNMLQGGGDTNIVKIMPINSGADIRSITLTAGKVPTTAKCYWKCISSGIATPTSPQTYSKGVTHGVTSTSTETNTFAEEFGISVSDKMQLELDTVTVSLNASFTATQSETESVGLTTQTNEVWGTSINPTTDQSSITYQIWQLVMQYSVNDTSIQQPVKLGDAPILVRQFIE